MFGISFCFNSAISKRREFNLYFLYLSMKKLLLLFALLIFSCSPFCSYSQNAFVNIETEAYNEFKKEGGSNQQWVDYKDEIIQRYNNKYYSKGKSQQEAIKELNQSQQQMQMIKNGNND